MSEKYLKYTAEDFAADGFFREWVLKKEPAASEFWGQWVVSNPDRRQEVLQAVAILTTLEIQEATVTETEIDQAVKQTLGRIHYENRKQVKLSVTYRRVFRYAAVLLLLLITWWGGGRIRQERPLTVSEEEVIEWLTVKNTGDSSRKQLLADGSMVILDPGALIKYRDTFEGERLVLLEGTAFFDVMKNAEKPFKVITNDLVTQVLGTSFKISSNAASGETKVRVVTGKVEVSKRMSSNKPSGATIVYPNQEIVFTQKQRQLTKTLVPEPIEIEVPEQKEVIYEDVQIGRIFDELSTRYGVAIHYDEKLLEGCQITASFSGETTFWEKLTLVCRPIRATVREKEGEVVIESAGCRF